MIKVDHLKKKYAGNTVLNTPEINIEKGESFGLVGNNGAGKTTFFRLILDLIKATEGAVYSGGENVAKTEHWKTYTGSYLDEGFLIDYLTPFEYFNYVGKLNGIQTGEVKNFMKEISGFLGNDIMNNKNYIRDLSKGNQKKTGIGAALMIHPEVLILDEPFSNLDPTSQYQLKSLLKEWQNKHQMCMLISSHDLNHVTEVCKRIVVLHEGEVVHDLETNANTLRELEDYFAVKGDAVVDE